MNFRALLVILVVIPCARSFSIRDATDIVSVVQEVIIDVLKMWELVGPHIEGDGPGHVDIPYVNNREKRVLNRMAEIYRKVGTVDKLVQSVATASHFNLKQDIPSQVRLELRIDTLLELVNMMNFADNTFSDYTVVDDNQTSPRLERHTLESFATYVVSHSPNSVQGLMDRLHAMIHPDTSEGSLFLNQGVLELIAKVLKSVRWMWTVDLRHEQNKWVAVEVDITFNVFFILVKQTHCRKWKRTEQEGEQSMCHVKQSPHQIIYNLYNSLQMTQLKGFTMTQFSWMLLRLYNKGNFSTESTLMKERYLSRMSEQAGSLKEALESADSAYWRCDPKHHIEGETYVQLTRLLQGYIQNEVDLNPSNNCEENCGYYQKAKYHGCYKDNYCASQKPCRGDIVECQYIDSDMWVCQADPITTNRRYEWIQYENGRLLGSKRSCYKESKVDSWWRWLFWHCSYCFCLCDDDTNSDRYFSLRNVLSATDDNKVITGLRFVKKNGIVHMQIQEGKLEHHGGIDQSSVTWQPVDDFKIRGTHEGKDYMKMTYFRRAIDLDDLKAPPEHVITGVKFRVVGSHLNLEIRATPFNFTSGQLLEPGRKDQWLSNDNTDGSPHSPRTKVALESPSNPLDALLPSQLDSQNDQFLLFTHSDINLDAAQTTVPFLDAQIVAPKPSVPLSGVGVYHKGQKLVGGFIGLKVFTYSYEHHIENNITDINNIDERRVII